MLNSIWMTGIIAKNVFDCMGHYTRWDLVSLNLREEGWEPVQNASGETGKRVRKTGKMPEFPPENWIRVAKKFKLGTATISFLQVPENTRLLRPAKRTSRNDKNDFLRSHQEKRKLNKTDLGFMPATAMITAIKKKTLSPREIVEALLARMEKINPKVNAYCTVVPEMALEAAKKAEAEIRQGETLGPLHGVPVSIKDLTLTAGIRTTFGSKIFEHHVPTEDALIVQRLKAAGAIVIGKTNTPEFGAGANTYNAVFGATRNPWKLSHTCGGPAGERRWPWLAASARWPQEAIWGVRCGFPPLFAAWLDSGPPPGESPFIPALWDGILWPWRGPWPERLRIRPLCSP